MLLVPAAVFVVALGLFAALDDTTDPAPAREGYDAARLAAQGGVELQRARETADPAHYTRAEGLLRRALAREPRNLDATIGMGTLALARHDFRGGLRLAREARRLAPGLARPYAALVDAQVELGRYPEAARSLQQMIDLRPNLASYARVSYLRELHGDLDGAAEAMSLAVSAGGQVPENVAYVQTLLGDLDFIRGRRPAARRAYATALAQKPGYVPALVSRARLNAASGRLAAAIRGYPERRLLAAQGVNTDVEVALFEADHGDPRRAAGLARRAWRAAPSVRSADAVSWALTQAGDPDRGLAWARRALKLGWSDPVVLTRAGLTARAAGQPAAARRYLPRDRASRRRATTLVPARPGRPEDDTHRVAPARGCGCSTPRGHPR